jgi:shikimate kinase
MKIFLIGFMGCGKSYIGKKLAAILGFEFLDLDSLIENTEGDTVGHIFETRGEPYFRQLESDSLKALSKWSDLVVATGGGAACFHDNIQWMNENGITVYLETTPQLLLERLVPQTAQRPLLRGKSEAELLTFIENRVADRAFYYSQAHITIHQSENDDEIVFEILKRILDYRQSN